MNTAIAIVGMVFLFIVLLLGVIAFVGAYIDRRK